jgi:thymidylate synthase ThyX
VTTRPDVFPLTDEEGRLYPPVRQAATLAKYSRSPESARVLVQQTPELKAEKFQQKVIVNWGHDSVAELATIPVCFEGVSIVASKVLESLPRPGCSEKSTRMQKFTRDQMCWPRPLAEFRGFVDRLFDLYDEVLEWAIKTNPTEVQGENTAHRAVQTNIEKAAFDIARLVLPAGVRTNLALVAYPRDLAKMIRVMGASTNPELVEIAEGMQVGLHKIGGPLIRHTEPDLWFQNWAVKHIPFSDLPWEKGKPRAKIAQSFALSDFMFWQAVKLMHDLDPDEFAQAMEDRPFKTEVPDVFRLSRATFDILIDYGAMRDLQRHRRMHQYVEPLTVGYGYNVPIPLHGTELESKFCKMMDYATQIIGESEYPADMKQYVTPMCFLHRSLYDMDFQQLYYLTELRTQPAGHISYRSIAHQMFVEAHYQCPTQLRWCRAIDPFETKA